MKRLDYSIIPIIILLTFALSSCTPNTPLKTVPVDNAVEGWAVLAEKDDYNDVGMTDLMVNYIDITRMKEALINQGWDPEKIHEVKEFGKSDLIDELNWLEEKADANDIVFFYVNAHGEYLRTIVLWNEFFSGEWNDIPSQKRILLVDSCRAARFTKPVRKDSEPHISIAAVDADEYGWKGLEEEGLPIVGGVFTFYFAEALTDPAADKNGDGQVSVIEAVDQAEEKQRDYMHDVVFAVPEFLEGYHNLGLQPEQDPTFPDAIVDDSIGEALFLGLE